MENIDSEEEKAADDEGKRKRMENDDEMRERAERKDMRKREKVHTNKTLMHCQTEGSDRRW